MCGSSSLRCTRPPQSAAPRPPRRCSLIADCEPQPRGYYAGPIGWWDEHGDGEFAVAIRSAVVAGDTAYGLRRCRHRPRL